MDGVEAFPSEANFILLRVANASAVWRDLLHEHSVLIRDLSRGEGLTDCLRVTVGTEAENARFLSGLADVLGRGQAAEGAAERARRGEAR